MVFDPRVVGRVAQSKGLDNREQRLKRRYFADADTVLEFRLPTGGYHGLCRELGHCR